MTASQRSQRRAPGHSSNHWVLVIQPARLATVQHRAREAQDGTSATRQEVQASYISVVTQSGYMIIIVHNHESRSSTVNTVMSSDHHKPSSGDTV